MANSKQKDRSTEDRTQAWLRYAEPGPEHEFFRQQEGDWRLLTRFWMDPGSLPIESEGVSENRMILGGRFLQSVYKGPTPYGPVFEGISIDGYDRLAGRHVGIWIDSMGTMMMVFTGDVDVSGKVRTMTGEFTDASTGRTSQMITKTTLQDEHAYLYEGFRQTASGWIKSMEIEYFRAE